jgi:hypothetical protein
LVSYGFDLLGNNDETQTMKHNIAYLINVILISTFLGAASLFAFRHGKGITEQECTTYEGASILWDLRIYRWVCCIPKGEDLEDCIVIIDKKPLPKTSIKPLPPAGSKIIVQPQQSSDDN